MFKWKQVVSGCLSSLMVFASLNCGVFPVSAQDAVKDHMVVHWDFEGKTNEEILSDKATAGSKQDALTMNAPDNTVLENGYAYLKEGGHNIALYAQPSSDTNQNGSQTIYMRVLMEDYTLEEYIHDGVNGDKGHQELFNQRDSGIFMQAVRWNYEKKDEWAFDTKVGEGNNGGWSSAHPDAGFWEAWYGNWVDVIAVIDVSDETENLKAKFYVNLTGEAAKSTEDLLLIHEYDTGVKSFNNAAVTRLGGYVGEAEWAWSAGHTKFDDVRIYDTALTLEQLVNVSQEASKKTEDDTGDNTTSTTTPAGQEDVKIPAEYLVNHWDFEGNGATEKLSDKATGGTAKDQLLLGEDSSVDLKDGYAYLNKAGRNIAMYTSELTDDTSLQGAQTLYLRLYLETYDESEWADPSGLSTDKGFQQIFDQRGEGGITMSVIKDDLSNPDTWKFDVKVGDKAGWTNTNPGKEFWAKLYDHWVELVVVIDEGDDGNLKASFYINFEGTAQNIEDFEKFFECDTKWPTLLVNDITRMGGYVNGGDWAWTTGHIKYDDVRMYNTALSVDQLVQVSKEIKNWNSNSNQSPNTGEHTSVVAVAALPLAVGIGALVLSKKRKSEKAHN